MKRFFSLIAIFLVGIALVGCFDLGETKTLEISKAPASTYVQGFQGEVNFAFKADGVEYDVVWTNGTVSSVTVGGKTYDHTKLEADGITISGLDFNTVGTKVLLVKYEGLTAQFEYQVVAPTNLSGTGTAVDPYVIHTADQMISISDKLENEDESNRVFVRLAADLDFSGKSFGALVNYATIDGSKGLGGNYKIINLSSPFFGNVTNLVLRNIDFVDCVSSTYIVGGTATDVTVENVNILGDSYAGIAGYFNTLEGNNSFLNCRTYASIINSSGSAGGFFRYAAKGKTTMDFCYNYGFIQTSSPDRVGGLVAAGSDGELIIRNSANYGQIRIFAPSSEFDRIETFLDSNLGVYTLVGSQKSNNSSTAWLNYNETTGEFSYVFITGSTSKQRVYIDNTSIQQSDKTKITKVEVAQKEITSSTTSEELELDPETIAYLGDFDSSQLVRYEITVVHTNSKGHKIDLDGILSAGGSSGNVVVYQKMFDITSTSEKVILPSVTVVEDNIKKPYSSLVEANQNVNGYDILQAPDNGVGYDIYAGGLFRIANKGKNETKMTVFGYNSQNEIIFIILGSVAVNVQ